jgi:uncharacterized membrane protein YvbJ
MKPCSKCGEGKRLSYKSYCRLCHNAMQKRQREKRKELNKSIHQVGWRWWYTHWCND